MSGALMYKNEGKLLFLCFNIILGFPYCNEFARVAMKFINSHIKALTLCSYRKRLFAAGGASTVQVMNMIQLQLRPISLRVATGW